MEVHELLQEIICSKNLKYRVFFSDIFTDDELMSMLAYIHLLVNEDEDTEISLICEDDNLDKYMNMVNHTRAIFDSNNDTIKEW
jgi:hypothetical protein